MVTGTASEWPLFFRKMGFSAGVSCRRRRGTIAPVRGSQILSREMRFQAFKTWHIDILSYRPTELLHWFAMFCIVLPCLAWNCKAEIAVGSVWAASARCSWDPVPGTEVPQMQMPWVSMAPVIQLWPAHQQNVVFLCLSRVRTAELFHVFSGVFFNLFGVWQGLLSLFSDWFSFFPECQGRRWWVSQRTVCLWVPKSSWDTLW